MEELIKQSDGSVDKVATEQTVVETFTPEQTDDVTRELDQIVEAIADIDNFKQRRLDNLNQRQAELLQYQTMLTTADFGTAPVDTATLVSPVTLASPSKVDAGLVSN